MSLLSAAVIVYNGSTPQGHHLARGNENSKVVALAKNSDRLKPKQRRARFAQQTPRSERFEIQIRLQVYQRARYYDCQTGEFTSQDPLKYVDGMSLYRGYFVPVDVDPGGNCIAPPACRFTRLNIAQMYNIYAKTYNRLAREGKHRELDRFENGYPWFFDPKTFSDGVERRFTFTEFGKLARAKGGSEIFAGIDITSKGRVAFLLGAGVRFNCPSCPTGRMAQIVHFKESYWDKNGTPLNGKKSSEIERFLLDGNGRQKNSFDQHQYFILAPAKTVKACIDVNFEICCSSTVAGFDGREPYLGEGEEECEGPKTKYGEKVCFEFDLSTPGRDGKNGRVRYKFYPETFVDETDLFAEVQR